MSYISVLLFEYPMKIKLQKLREGTSYQSYRVAIPKSIIEAKGWQEKEFDLEDKGSYLVLRPSKK